MFLFCVYEKEVFINPDNIGTLLSSIMIIDSSP
jgi:hypothetical protein